MTAREIYLALLTELSKVSAPSMLLDDFNYYINKAVSNYINKRYNIYNTSLQTTDDLRVLKATAILPTKEEINNLPWFGNIKVVYLPNDYLHILNCICVFKYKENLKSSCSATKDGYISYPAIKLIEDAWGTIITDYYNKPSIKKPYFYINNVNTQTELPTNPFESETGKGTDMNGDYKVNSTNIGNSNLSRTITIGGNKDKSLITKDIANRYGNASKVRMEIRYGFEKEPPELVNVIVDYLKTPLYIKLTQKLLDLIEDTSLIIEFPDYGCQEIINELVILVMESNADPRLQTHIPVSLTIAYPTQRL